MIIHPCRLPPSRGRAWRQARSPLDFRLHVGHTDVDVYAVLGGLRLRHLLEVDDRPVLAADDHAAGIVGVALQRLPQNFESLAGSAQSIVMQCSLPMRVSLSRRRRAHP